MKTYTATDAHMERTRATLLWIDETKQKSRKSKDNYDEILGFCKLASSRLEIMVYIALKRKMTNRNGRISTIELCEDVGTDAYTLMEIIREIKNKCYKQFSLEYDLADLKYYQI